MQKLLEKLDSTYRKSVRHRKREAEKLNSTEIESDYTLFTKNKTVFKTVLEERLKIPEQTIYNFLHIPP